MVIKQQLDDCIDKLSTDLTAKLKSMLEESISNIKDTIIENLKISNEKLQIRVGLLENNVKDLENEKIEKEKEPIRSEFTLILTDVVGFRNVTLTV